MAPGREVQPGEDRSDLPHFLIIGAGSRGHSYARALQDSGLGIVAGLAEPNVYKRTKFTLRFFPKGSPPPAFFQEFEGWKEYVTFEEQRRIDGAAGLPTPPKMDGAFICVQDHLHVEVASALGPLGLHMMCEKPLATRLDDCLQIQTSIESGPESIFAVGHVLRYSPHNMLLRHLVREKEVIGDVYSIEHTEPVGWWHFAHSYVRGNWRKESTSAPSLMTKSCHDIDFILWMLCSPIDASESSCHLPATISSVGSLKQFRHANRPKAAGISTNCLSCPIQKTCMFSAPRIYYDNQLAKGNTKWPIDVVNPEIEALDSIISAENAKKKLMNTLAENYSLLETPVEDIESRPWYGRCVWASDNDVVDDQFVTFEWVDDKHGSAKSANFHMIAQTLSQCERRGRIYGSTGEIAYDSKSITVHNFTNGTTEVYNPEVPKNSHHGGGDDGLTQQFAKAVAAVKSGEMSVDVAQTTFLGCTVEEIVRSHAAVFAAEEARLGKKVVEWNEWWAANVEPVLRNARLKRGAKD